MTPLTLLNQAKAGNPVAIAMLINRQISGLGMKAKVCRQKYHLQILLESAEHIPSRKKATRYFRRALTTLDPVALTKVKIYGRRVGMSNVAWAESIDLVNLAVPTPTMLGDTPPNLFPEKRTSCDTPAELGQAPSYSDTELGFGSQEGGSDICAEQSSLVVQPKIKITALVWLWCQWQMTNLKGGLLLIVGLWLISSLIFFVLAQFLQEYLGVAVLTAMLAGGLISLLLGGLFIGDSQAYFLKKYLPNAGQWRWATFFGFGLGCALAGGIQFAGYTLGTLALFTLLPLAPFLVAIASCLGGAVLGGVVSFFQWLTLRRTVRPSYGWIIWNTIAGIISALIAVGGGGAAAGWVAYQLQVLGFPVVDVTGGGIIVYGIVASALAWISYHAITGLKMARLLQRLPVIGKK